MDAILSNFVEPNSPNTASESPRISQARPKFLKQNTMAASEGTALRSLWLSRKRVSSMASGLLPVPEYSFLTAKVIPPMRITAVATSVINVLLFMGLGL